MLSPGERYWLQTGQTFLGRAPSEPHIRKLKASIRKKMIQAAQDFVIARDTGICPEAFAILEKTKKDQPKPIIDPNYPDLSNLPSDPKDWV